MSIHVRNWEKFQHADVIKRGRAAVWIRVYTELLSDEAFLALSSHRRALLLCIWLEYARSRARLPLEPRSLAARFQMRVTMTDLEALNHAGFIELPSRQRQDSVTPPSRLEERRGEQELQNPSPTAVVKDVDPDEQILDELAARRQTRPVKPGQGLEVNGRAGAAVIAELVADLQERAARGP